MGEVFISYAHEDREKAQRIAERLKVLGFTPWIDEAAPASRDDISTVIDDRIKDVDSVLVLWSASSRSSVWVRGEALKGLEGNKYFGCLLAKMVPPIPFNAIAAPDLQDWTGLNDHLGWNALVRGLASQASAGRAAIVAKLDAAQKKERDETARQANTQEVLPLGEPEQPLDEGPHYGDVDAIVMAAKAILGSAAKLDLTTAMTQAALDQEMLRDAAYVVSTDGQAERPSGAPFKIVLTINAALEAAQENDLIVIGRGVHDENIVTDKNVRLVGLGTATGERPTIRAKAPRAAVVFRGSARLENLAIETRQQHYAVHCERGQPVLLRCDLRRFSEERNEWDGAFYVAQRANPIVIASSIAATGCHVAYFTASSGGQFIGVNFLSMRGDAIHCRGRPVFSGCTIEAIGAHAVLVLSSGSPAFEDCEISGRGAPVIRVADQARPRIKESRVNAIRQLVFDFDGNAMGRYEGNIVSRESGEQAGTGRKVGSGFFAFLKSKQDTFVQSATRMDELARLQGLSKPLFIANTTVDGGVFQPTAPATS